MSEETGAFLTGAALGMMATAGLVMLTGGSPSEQRRRFELEACAAGAARYDANPTNGAVVFKWIGGAK